jgi:hypothetical protein
MEVMRDVFRLLVQAGPQGMPAGAVAETLNLAPNIGMEAIIPVNRFSGHGTGVIAQFHLYLDDIFPTTIGQPLLGPRTSAPQLPFGG